MKKIVSLMFTAMLAAQCLMAQFNDGIKYLNYGKNKSAKEAFQKLYDANPKDPQAVYWLGQAILATDGGEPGKEQIQATKTLYQKGLADIGTDAWLLVGMGQVEILEGGDLNSAKQKFEQAITATTETKGKNKGKPNPAILNAIGRANAKVAIAQGDHAYAVDKLKQAAAIDLTNADIYINMGINYLKMGGENGGEAVKAYQEAVNRDPKSALAFYQIGKIYQSQNNKDLFEQNFNNAIIADPAFPLSYFAFYTYYANKDVNKAKEYLDKYVANADKDPRTDYFVAEYLFRAGKNAESIAKIKELEGSAGLKVIPRLSILYAYNYDRLGDSAQAKTNIEKFFANAPADKIEPGDYELAVKVMSKFPGSEAVAATYIDKALGTDTSKLNKINYAQQAADMFGKAKMYTDQLKWMQKVVDLKGATGEGDYYRMATAAFSAKDFTQTMEISKKYMTAFPDKPQPYTFFKKAAIASDPDTTGIAVNYLLYLDSIYTVMNKEKYKRDIFLNQYYILNSYTKKMVTLQHNPDFKVKTDGTKTPLVEEFLAISQKAVEITESMLQAYPDPNDDNNRYALQAKTQIQKGIDYYTKPPTKKSGPAAAGNGGMGPKG